MVLEYDLLRAKVGLGKASLGLLFHALLAGSFAWSAAHAPGVARREVVAWGMVLLPALGALLLVVVAVASALIPFAMRLRIVLDENGVRSHGTFEPPVLWAVLAYARRRGWDASELQKPMWSVGWREIRRAHVETKGDERKLVLGTAEGKRSISLRGVPEGELRDEPALFAALRANGIAVELPPSPPAPEKSPSPLWREAGRSLGRVARRREPQRLE